jgi:hypothetical protein
MSKNFVIFDTISGAPKRLGTISDVDFPLIELNENEKLLVTQFIDVDSNKAIVYEDVKLIRQALLDAGVPTTFGVTDSDLLSRVNVTGVALAALIAQLNSLPFSRKWTMKDNTPRIFTASEFIQFFLEGTLHLGQIYDRAVELRDSINACTTMAELLAIDITTGWPASA